MQRAQSGVSYETTVAYPENTLRAFSAIRSSKSKGNKKININLLYLPLVYSPQGACFMLPSGDWISPPLFIPS